MNYRKSLEHVETRGDDEWTESHEETMAKIRAVMTFVIAQVAVRPMLVANHHVD